MALNSGSESQNVSKKTISVCRKLMLNTQLWGVEALCNFEQLYLMAVLQMLGVPVNLVTLMGLASGVATLTFLPLVGWLSDRGSNQHRRKIVTVAFSTSLLVLAMVLIITANMIHLTDVLASNASMIASHFDNSNLNQSTVNKSCIRSGASDGHKFAIVSGATDGRFVGTNLSDDCGELSQENVSIVSVEDHTATSGTTLKTTLGILGFLAAEIDLESNNCFAKSFVLSCSPRDEHTSILVMGLFMASAGGLSTAVLGAVDIPSFLGLSHLKGVGLAIQTSFQAMIIMSCSTISICITLIAGHKQFKELQNCFMDSKCSELMQESIISLEEKDHVLSDKKDFSASQTISASYNSNTNLNSPRSLTKAQTVNGIPHKYSVDPKEATDEENIPNNASHLKLKVTFLCLAMYFCAGSVYCFAMTTSDFVGKAIYEGDPDSYPGSGSFLRYQQGLRLASSGLIVYYGSYLLVNFAQPRLLAALGYRVEFVLAHLLLSTMLLTVTFFTRVDVYFMLTVVAGLQRACYQSIPYAVANDIINSDQSNQGGKSHVGLAMSLVAMTIPMSFCTLFPLIGPMEKLTGSVSAPLWMGAGYSCLAALSFVCIGKI